MNHDFQTDWQPAPHLRKRYVHASIAAAIVFLLLLLRLWQLQVISDEHYRNLSEKNRTRYIPIAAQRGRVFDRDGQLLADNRPAFDVAVLRQEVDDPGMLLDRLSGFLSVDREELHKRWEAGKRLPRYRPIPLAWDVDRDTLEKIMENAVNLPGVLMETRPVRSFPLGPLAPHFLGYLGEITEKELGAPEFEGYHAGDVIGKAGLEKNLEPILAGTDGERRVEVDVKGKSMRILKTLDPQPGSEVVLTLQASLQQVAEQAFGEQAGAAVVLDVHTGEILAIASQPAFDPAQFARGLTAKEWRELQNNPLNPLQNRAISGQYPPGSIFKIVTALAALKAGGASADTRVFCKGSSKVGNHTFRCWKRSGHGTTDLHKALKESCDVWFYEVSQKVGIDRIAAMARDLGLGRTYGLPFEMEKAGLIPDKAWKMKRFGTSWYRGETLNAAIGQGYILTTPLQLAVMTAAVANGGTLYRPHIVKSTQDPAKRIVRHTQPEILHRVFLPPAHLAAVRQGLEAVVNEPGGTAWSSRLEALPFAGKTGTAQVVKLRDGVRDENLIPYRFRDHALFSAYAPADKPRIAVAVVVEHGSHGSSAAAPIARAIIAHYFGLDKTPVPPQSQPRQASATPASPDPAPPVPSAPLSTPAEPPVNTQPTTPDLLPTPPSVPEQPEPSIPEANG
ncbi:penicillin-binding protein 2 [Syntrophotalea acetylenica]|uniref:penicillin-binding protein 2 n=1 Tax=Syntrophotalea acetylenica TaxID=29542 RepID=UPI0009FA914F|nr:penicillin-binding protein 2 [Syntrophotalea acetylenica]